VDGEHNEKRQQEIGGGGGKTERANQDQECAQRGHDIDGLVREERFPGEHAARSTQAHLGNWYSRLQCTRRF